MEMLTLNPCVSACYFVYVLEKPQYAPEEVLYQGSVKVSCWEEQGKKCRERYAVLRRDYKVEIHDSMEVTHGSIDTRLRTVRDVFRVSDFCPDNIA